ncbi:MAG: FtsW/RodA/SpoVE family cell cycle protein [Oscillospiraceae bacterium]|jgi:rod shape determining protein RodA
MKKLRSARPFILDFFRRADMILFILCLICSIFGIVLISSAVQTFDNPSRYILIQVLSLVMGIGLFIIFTIIDIDIIADKWIFLFLFSVFFLLLLIPFGSEQDGNKGWLRFFGIGIQPSEVVKFIFIVLLAKQLSHLRMHKNLNSISSMAQLVVHFGFMFCLVIVVSSDLGSALVFMFAFLIMLFAAGVKLYWFAIGLACLAAATPLLWKYFLTDVHKNRILAPYVASIDPNGTGVKWQTNQSRIAFANGGWTGRGLYNGTQIQSDNLAGKHTDFIFSVAGEELGMIACIIIMVLLLLIVVRCVYIGIKSKNTMNMLICIGIASVIFFQTFENIGMCIGIAPVIGLPLPFFSYGGSSMFALFSAMGLVSGIRYQPSPQLFRSE